VKTVVSNSTFDRGSLSPIYVKPFDVFCEWGHFRGRKVNLSHVFAGQSVGVTQVGERTWLVTFMHSASMTSHVRSML